ncbi:extracellular calcium-sensing receptor-like [Protopterus annectens]|uniref:extracellular calcium-sensing receptor-like n=1 Tax=Protopterus annectens TaxID=7888 RepID=UPI001CFAFB19|nr:extracellular calcium-sensing receptor-like [Protopterus annectens]
MNISHGAAVASLSDKSEFPSFSRTVSNFNSHALGLTRLAMYFGWTWLGIISSDDDYGQLGSRSLRNSLITAGGCLDFQETVPRTNARTKLMQIIETIKRSTAKVIVVYVSKKNIVPIMEEISAHDIMDRVWIISDTCTVSQEAFNKKMLETINGTIGLAHHTMEMVGFQDSVYRIHPLTQQDDIFIKPFWEKAFSCTWANSSMKNSTLIANGRTSFCTGEEKVQDLDVSLFNIYTSVLASRAYNALYSVAHALHDMLTCQNQRGPFLNGSCVDILSFEPWQLLHYVRNVHFKTHAGEEVFFDSNGDPPVEYDILNQQISDVGALSCVKVGSFRTAAPKGKEIMINDTGIRWNGAINGSTALLRGAALRLNFGDRGSVNQNLRKCNLAICIKCSESQWASDKRDRCIPRLPEYLSFEDTLGVTFSAISTVCTLITATILCVFLKYRETPLVRANNRELSYLLLLSLMLCFLCSFIFIGQPMGVSCRSRQIIFITVFSFCISCVLAKTITVVIAFSATQPESRLRQWVGSRIPTFFILVVSQVHILIDISWLGTAPPFVQHNIKFAKDKIIIECNEGSIAMFYCMLGYLGLLASVSFIVAFLARKLPDNFNEAKYITFSMLAFTSVWVSFIPAYVSANGKYVAAVEIFAILCSSAALLICIFIPKCYIILLRPKMNTKDYLMGKKNVHNC